MWIYASRRGSSFELETLEGSLPPCTGQSVERWPPEEAGRETAGNMSRATIECGVKGQSPTTLTLPNTYVMMCQAATNTVKLTGAILKEAILTEGYHPEGARWFKS